MQKNYKIITKETRYKYCFGFPINTKIPQLKCVFCLFRVQLTHASEHKTHAQKKLVEKIRRIF